MIGMSIDAKDVKRLQESLGKRAKRLPQELAVAVNAATKKGRSEINKEIRKELAVKAASLNRVLKQTKKATKASGTAQITLNKEQRLSLKDFGARQNKAGVSYKISPKKGRKLIAGGFMGPKPGVTAIKLRGNAFKRMGKTRLPIVKLMGASPWGAWHVNKLRTPMTKIIQAELKKQIERRIRFHVLKAQGAI